MASAASVCGLAANKGTLPKGDVPVGMDIWHNSNQCSNCGDIWNNANQITDPRTIALWYGTAAVGPVAYSYFTEGAILSTASDLWISTGYPGFKVVQWTAEQGVSPQTPSWLDIFEMGLDKIRRH